MHERLQQLRKPATTSFDELGRCGIVDLLWPINLCIALLISFFQQISHFDRKNLNRQKKRKVAREEKKGQLWHKNEHIPPPFALIISTLMPYSKLDEMQPFCRQNAHCWRKWKRQASILDYLSTWVDFAWLLNERESAIGSN